MSSGYRPRSPLPASPTPRRIELVWINRCKQCAVPEATSTLLRDVRWIAGDAERRLTLA